MSANESDFPGTLGAAVAIILTAGLIVAVGLVPPAVFYMAIGAVAVASASLARRRSFLWTVTAILIAADLAGLWRSGRPQSHGANEAGLNYLLAILAALATAAVADLWIASVGALHDQRRALTTREVEIARQNLALQGQGEELERRSAALQVTNQHLSSRELVLAQLLDLSRSLATRLNTDEVTTRICTALASVFSRDDEPRAAAVLVRDGEVMRVVSAVGFGDESLEGETFPLRQTVAALVMARGQTMSIDDLAESPREMRVSQPTSGPAIRSVLSAPLWVNGQVIGVIEAYGRNPASWTEEDVGLIGSMAAQAAISLQAARLFEEIEGGRGRFEAVIHALPIPLLVAQDAECLLVSGNEAAAALFGVPASANFSPFAPPASLVRVMGIRDGVPLAAEELPVVRAVRSGEEVAVHELDLMLAGERRLSVLASATPLRDAGDRVTGGVCTFVDITVQKAMEREVEVRRGEAEEASARKSRFLAAVSHDIRTPANAIRLQAALIKRRAADPATMGDVPRLTTQLEESAALLVDLVSDMLDITRLDGHLVDLRESAFELDAMIEAECVNLRAMVQESCVGLAHVPAERVLWMRADRVKLGRVIGNLLENGMKFTSAGEVRIHASTTADGRIRIEVADTGAGIAAEDVPNIFDEFFQLRNPERNRRKGTGLGLAICKRLVEAMGGTLTVESLLGQGSRFIVLLPAIMAIPAPDDGLQPAGNPSVPASLEGVRVVLAEDHDVTRAACTALLRGEGANVTEARDGVEALEMVDAVRPQVLLLDLMMPRLDGVGVLRRLQNARPPPLEAVIVVSGDRRAQAVDEMRELGVDAVITKPIDPSRLVHLLRGMTGRLQAPH